MEIRKLGTTDLNVSALCMGTMQFGWTADEATSFEVLSASYEAGINFIDTADIYSRSRRCLRRDYREMDAKIQHPA